MSVHQITDASAVKSFVHAGDARFTLVSTASGKRITFRVAYPRDRETNKVKRDGLMFVSVLTGADNETSYSYLGFITPTGEYRHGGAKAKVHADAPSARAFDWFYRNLRQNHLSDQMEFWHEGRCGRCGRTLTVPSSIASGFGPECIGLGSF
jgi:hypothetical protein